MFITIALGLIRLIAEGPHLFDYLNFFSFKFIPILLHVSAVLQSNVVVAEINEIFENFLSPEVLGFLSFGG